MAESKKAVYGALAANLLIAITKFIAGGITNSASMISEGIHSVVDSTNQVLLLYGIKRSKKPADKIRPLGYGKELYFWSFMVAILIFGLGGGLTIYQGIMSIRNPEVLKDPTINYIVLGISLVIEGISFSIAIKEFNASRGNVGWWAAVKASKDPANFLVLFEDAAAVLGLVIVAVMLALSHALDMPALDGVASIMVGVLLAVVAILLGRESRSLLMGEGVSPESQSRIKALVESDHDVKAVSRIISTYQSPEEVVLMLIIEFREEMETIAISNAIARIRQVVKQKFDYVEYVVIEPRSHA